MFVLSKREHPWFDIFLLIVVWLMKVCEFLVNIFYFKLQMFPRFCKFAFVRPHKSFQLKHLIKVICNKFYVIPLQEFSVIRQPTKILRRPKILKHRFIYEACSFATPDGGFRVDLPILLLFGYEDLNLKSVVKSKKWFWLSKCTKVSVSSSYLLKFWFFLSLEDHQEKQSFAPLHRLSQQQLYAYITSL